MCRSWTLAGARFISTITPGQQIRRCAPESLPLQRPATLGAVGELFGIGLACLLVVEEHPSVLTFDPPELSPEVSSLLACTTQRRHLRPPSLSSAVIVVYVTIRDLTLHAGR